MAAAGVVVGGLSQWETPDEHLQTLLDVNVLGVWTTAAVTVPVHARRPAPAECRFVAVASAAGERGLFKLAGYVASKHAVIGIVRGLAADLVGTGLAAIAVAPGSTDTPMLAATADLYDTTPHGSSPSSRASGGSSPPRRSRPRSPCAAPPPVPRSTARSSAPTAASADPAGPRAGAAPAGVREGPAGAELAQAAVPGPVPRRTPAVTDSGSCRLGSTEMVL